MGMPGTVEPRPETPVNPPITDTADVSLPQYAHWTGYEVWLEMNTLRLMTDLWMGPFSWVPDAEQATRLNR